MARYLYAFSIFTTFFCCCGLAATESQGKVPVLIVKSIGVVSKPADELIIDVGVVSQGDTAEKALGENSEKVRSIIDALNLSGLTDKEYKTGYFTIFPLYDEKPKTAGADWKPSIIGYRVTNSLTVTTEKTQLAGALLDRITKAGANNIDRVAFSLKDPRKYRSEAIAAATRNAFNDAMSLSNASGVAIQRILSIALDDAGSPAPLQGKVFYARSAEGTPIESGEVNVQATVAIEFIISDAVGLKNLKSN